MIIKLREDSWQARRDMNSWLAENIMYEGPDPWLYDYMPLQRGVRPFIQPVLRIDGRLLRGVRLTEFRLRFC